MRKNYVKFAEFLSNVFEVLAILSILTLALLFQFYYKELPCPLCLLQRVGFVGIIFGFLLNLRFGHRPSHYAIVILSGLFTSFVALRQIALHVIPGTGAYGDAIFGFHLYTWSFIIAICLVVSAALLLASDRQYFISVKPITQWPIISHFIFAVVTLLVSINLVAVFLECGLKTCPDNPTSYELLKSR